MVSRTTNSFFFGKKMGVPLIIFFKKLGLSTPRVLPKLARKKKVPRKANKNLPIFLVNKQKKNTDFDLFQKKKSQVIFLASQFFIFVWYSYVLAVFTLGFTKKSKIFVFGYNFYFLNFKKKRPRKLLG